jgi:hypothetical protein
MSVNMSQPKINSFQGAQHIPAALRNQKRWAPWKAVYNEKRGKFDKIPVALNGPHGISTANLAKWGTFEDALRAYNANPEATGVGYCMTGHHGVVGFDLDNCIDDSGVIAPWAVAVINSVESYTEVSPSGHGVRCFAEGEAKDWMNHQVGIEVYGGDAPRFLTITGTHVGGTPTELRPLTPGVMAELRAKYGRDFRKVEIEAADMPDLLPELMLPDHHDLDLMYYTRDFLDDGVTRGVDRSGELHVAAIALFQAGLDEQEVFSVLVNNPHAMEIALDHRRQDTDRASLYIWVEHCQKAKPKADARRITADAFDDLGAPEIDMPAPDAGATEQAQTADPLAGFDDISTDADKAAKTEKAKPKEHRFRVQDIFEFLKRPAASWFIKGVLPKAGLAVVFGESGSGKTFYVLDMVSAIARGQQWRGMKTTQGRVVYICAEGESGFRTRLTAHCKHHGIDQMPLGVIGDAPNFMEKNDIKDLIAAVKSYGPTDIIVVDTFAQVMPGANENSGEDVGRALAHCKALHRVTGALVILVHHSGKDSSKGARGWSGLRAAADAEIEVVRAPQMRSATITKLKDGEDGEEYGFTLTTVVIGQDDDGDDISSCVVTHNDLKASEVKSKTPGTENQQLILSLFTGLLMGDNHVDFAVLAKYVADRSPIKPGEKARMDNIKRSIRNMSPQYFTVLDDKVFPQSPHSPSID